MDVLEGLMTQHRVAEHFFKEILAARAPEAKERLLRELVDKLDEHMDFEETIFYPALEAVDSSLVEHNYDEHQQAKPILSALLGMKGGSPEFMDHLTRVRSLIETHVRKEEDELFPACKTHLDTAALEHLGIEFESWGKGQHQTRSPHRDHHHPSP